MLWENIISNDYTNLIKKLQNFYNAYEEFWMIEKKSFGFEVQDIRIGGLIQRVKHCKMVLNKYVTGETDRIEELEQEILIPFGADHKKIGCNYYGYLPTTSVL